VLTRRLDIFQSLITFISYPYLKEEVRIILDTWKNPFFGDIWSFIIEKLDQKTLYKYLYFSTKILFILLIPLFQGILLLCFALAHGDLRYVFYLIPFSFLSWIFCYFDYYFQFFFESTTLYIRSMLRASLVDDNNAKEVSLGVINTNQDNIQFHLTQQSITEGYNDGDIPYLSSEWLQHARLFVVFERYKTYTSYLSSINLFLRVVSWVSITLYFFYPFNNSEYLAFLTRRSLGIGKSVIPKRVPLDAYKVRKGYGQQLEKKTNGDYKHPHPVVTDMDEKSHGEVPLKAQPTHGQGSPTNLSVNLHRTKDPNGPHPKGQGMVVHDGDTTVPVVWLESLPVPGAQKFFEDGEVKTNIAKYTYRDDDNT